MYILNILSIWYFYTCLLNKTNVKCLRYKLLHLLSISFCKNSLEKWISTNTNLKLLLSGTVLQELVQLLQAFVCFYIYVPPSLISSYSTQPLPALSVKYVKIILLETNAIKHYTDYIFPEHNIYLQVN